MERLRGWGFSNTQLHFANNEICFAARDGLFDHCGFALFYDTTSIEGGGAGVVQFNLVQLAARYGAH